MKQLANDILDFLDKYASISPNYNPDFDDDDDKYTGPDPGQLKIAAIKLKNGQVIKATNNHKWYVANTDHKANEPMYLCKLTEELKSEIVLDN